LDKIADVYDELIKEIDVKMTNPARVVFARDTRASGSRLVGVLNAALTATEVEFVDLKYMTTPQLHYVVRCKNTLGTQYEYGEPTEQGYYEKLANSFKKVMRGVKVQGSLTVDCANGVGGPKLRELMKYLTGIDIKVVNDDVINPDALNFDVCFHLPNTQLSINLTFHAVRCRLCQDQATCSSFFQSCRA
jgi:phosphoacetylglucosamine mutase